MSAFVGVLVFSVLLIGFVGMSHQPPRTVVEVSPPPIVMSEPSDVVMMPDTGVYYVPSAGVDVFFYNDYWWSQRGGGWYRSNQYNGQWVVVERSYVPAPLFRVPVNYRVVYKNERRINYRQWRERPGNTTIIQHNTTNIQKNTTNVQRKTPKVRKNVKVQKNAPKIQKNAKRENNEKRQ